MQGFLMIVYCFINQLGHMRTNKNCPKYGEDPETPIETADLEKASGKSNSLDPSAQSQQKPLTKNLVQKGATKITLPETPEGENSSSKAKLLPVKFKCRTAEEIPEKTTPENTAISDQPASSQAETGNKSIAKVSKVIISNKIRAEDVQVESHKPAVVIKPPADAEKEQPRKKIIIKRPKEVCFDQASHDGSTDMEYRKTKKIVELSNFEMNKNLESVFIGEETTRKKVTEEKRWWEEEEKRRNAERQKEEIARRRYVEMRMLEEQERLTEIKRYEEAIRREREEEERQKAKKKKKKKTTEIRDDYAEDFKARRKWFPERDRNAKRRPAVESARYSDHAPPAKRRRGGEVFLHALALSCVYHSCVTSLLF